MELKNKINTSHIKMLRINVRQYVKLILNAKLLLSKKSIAIFSNSALRLKSLIKWEI